jgi:predicted translin family RNA/ssDNA-binding protein
MNTRELLKQQLDLCEEEDLEQIARFMEFLQFRHANDLIMADSPDENYRQEWVEEVRAKIDVAAAQLDRGEGIDGETAIAQLRAKFYPHRSD